jgi:hypothetical protein
MPKNEDLQSRRDAILQEIRIILPGTQALLGFQFVAFFNTSFKELSANLQVYHLINLLLTTLCAILLIAPVAYQEIRTNGHYNTRWLSFTSRSLTFSMFFLLLGLSGDIFIAATLLESQLSFIPYLAAIGTFLIGSFLWFGLMLFKRR